MENYLRHYGWIIKVWILGKTKTLIQEIRIKLVLNILYGSHLLNKIYIIMQCPSDYEINVPFIKNEFNAWSGKVTFNEF